MNVESQSAVELFHADGRPAGVFYCPKCRNVAKTRETAESCCRAKLCKCGRESERYHNLCRICQSAQRAEREAARFEAAAKATEWGGPVYDEAADRYHASLEELEDWLENEDESEPQRYAWACEEAPVCVLDYDTIIESATSDAYEDFDRGSLEGEAELKAALDAFNERNKGNTSWIPNYKLAILAGEGGRQ